jgi:hypothetical protein
MYFIDKLLMTKNNDAIFVLKTATDRPQLQHKAATILSADHIKSFLCIDT